MTVEPHPSHIVVQLTPPGRGAVATVRIEGPGCAEIVDRFFASRNGKTLTDTPPDRPLVGHFHSPTSPAAEEVVARRCSDHAVEIHCHGGTASVSRIVATFEDAEYTALSWEEWIDREEKQKTLSPIRAEACRDLARAQTELTATLLLDQYHGALDRELDQIDQLDDPTEKRRRLDTLLQRATWGVHLVQPWQIVIAGSPNVGKSSLMNRLLGYDRAITDPTPGTTRDLLRTPTVLSGWPVELIDTAGLREGDHPVEQLGIKRALAQLRSADLILLLLDATRPPTEPELAFTKPHPDNPLPPLLPIRSKSDLAPTRDPWGTFADTPTAAAALDTSAATGHGLDHLLTTIATHLFPPPPAPGTPIPWTARQIEALREMTQALKP